MAKNPVPIPASGVYAALVTPRRRDSVEADTAAYLEYLDKVSAAGVDGLVFFGSTGEFVHFDVEERMRVVGLAVKRSRVPVLVNISHSTFSGARDLAEHAIESGAHGLLVMPPYFYAYGESEIGQFYSDFRRAVDGRIPIYLYNLPFFTNPISSGLMDVLLSSGGFAGIKDSSGKWDTFERLQGIRGRVPFRLLIGHECIYVKGLLAGADGVVSGVAAAVPELPVALKRAIAAQNASVTERLASQLDGFLSWSMQFPATIAIKEAAEMRGWTRSTVAIPLAPASQEKLVVFRGWFDRWLPETLELCSSKAV